MKFQTQLDAGYAANFSSTPSMFGASHEVTLLVLAAVSGTWSQCVPTTASTSSEWMIDTFGSGCFLSDLEMYCFRY